MNTHAIKLKRRFVAALGRAALEYLVAGFSLFHRHRNSEAACSQAAFGNLAVALELTLKCVLAEKNLGAVFQAMPPESRMLLSAPDRVPEFFRWFNSSLDLCSDTFETIDLDGCITGYYVFAPHMKQMLMPHLSFIVKRAGASMRTALPPLTPYEFERTGYAVLQTVISLGGDDAYTGCVAFSPGEAEKHFLDEFSANRVERVSLALERARLTARERTSEERQLTIPSERWQMYAVSCPVCGFGGLLDGYSELSLSGGEEGPGPGLDFFAVSFSCPDCGLVLYDLEELKLAGMAMIYDRSEELDAWLEEHGGLNFWGME